MDDSVANVCLDFIPLFSATKQCVINFFTYFFIPACKEREVNS
jgi:hypothetical protein